MQTVKRIFFIILILAVLFVAFIGGLFAFIHYMNTHHSKQKDFGGEIERTYGCPGPLDVSYAEFTAADEAFGSYDIWYPSEIKDTKDTYPLIVMANGTGTTAPKYKDVFKHLASWGFIVVGNEDENSRSGASSCASLDFILSLNDDKTSDFYHKVDTSNIGIAGHSQGGVGVFNAVTAQPNGGMYQAMFTASATSPYWGQENVFGAEWSYDASAVAIPCFMVAGTGYFDAGTATDITATEGQGICPLWAMREIYNTLPDSVPKAMARAVGKDHGDMLRYVNGYMTAWFLYWLQDNEEAGNAFFGEEPELGRNPLYQDQQISELQVRNCK